MHIGCFAHGVGFYGSVRAARKSVGLDEGEALPCLSVNRGLARRSTRSGRRSCWQRRAARVDVAIATNLSVGVATAYRTERCFAEEGLEAALSEEPRLEADRKLSATWTHLAEKRRIRA